MQLSPTFRLLSLAVLSSLFFAAAGNSQSITYVGVYSSDGRFHAPSKFDRWSNAASPDVEPESLRPAEVPAWVNLHPIEQTVANYQPPSRAVSPKAPSSWATLRDNIITFAYGHERLISAPQRVIVDSNDRVILADPAGSAVHVLGKTKTFRILTGAGRRVWKPAGLAVDADDNIYIADPEQGVIAEYDPEGSFLRYIGKLGSNESLFHLPTGIAIDRRTGTLYVLDTERHALFLLDLEGRLVRRIGRYTTNDARADFEYPTDIAVGDGELAILDAAGTRIWITDLAGKPRQKFSVALHDHPDMTDRLGIGMDAAGNVYLSNAGDSSVRVYNRAGELLQSLGSLGSGAGEFRAPTGLWIDAHGRLFVADESARRVQVFQLSAPKQLLMAVGE